MDPLDLALRIGPPLVAGLAAGFAWATVRASRRTIAMLHETAEVAIDKLEAMEQSQDPGREVSDRLARAFESRLITIDGPKVEPHHRRASAQVMAAQTIETIRLAKLALVDAEDPAASG